MEFLTEFGEVWGDVQARHAMMTHMPIVLSIIAAVAVILTAIKKGKNRQLHWTALIFTVALTASAFTAKQSGAEAEETVEGALSEKGEHVLEHHEELGEKVWYFGAAGCVLLGLGFVKKRERLRIGSTWCAAAVGVVAAGWTANTAHHGGQLVYEYGAVSGSSETVSATTAEPAQAGGDPRVAHFRGQILPILSEVCWQCHNPERMHRAANLDQTNIATFLKGGDSGPPIVPGKPQESLLIRALSYADEDLQMPPDERLPDDVIAAFETWIRDGAVWDLPD